MNTALSRSAWVCPFLILGTIVGLTFKQLSASPNQFSPTSTSLNSHRLALSTGSTFALNCPHCNGKYELYGRFVTSDNPLPAPSAPKSKGVYAYPTQNDIFVCPNCKTHINVAERRQMIEEAEQQKFVP